MATSSPTAIQFVGRGKTTNNVFDNDKLEGLINSSNEPKKHYIVVSIIGTQSSGKSTLMNALFETNFKEMDKKKARGTTTNGIWAGICHSSSALVLDIEGTDGEQHKYDLGFETRSSLFALVVSDVVIINMWHKDIGLTHGIRLLTNIFQERAKLAGSGRLTQQHKTTIVFAVRDYDDEENPEALKQNLFATVDEIWNTIPQRADSKLESYFTRRVEFFPSYQYCKKQFRDKCEEMRKLIHERDGRFFVGTPSSLPVCNFPSYAKGLWEIILKNKALDLPSQMEMSARASCMNIQSELFQHFQSDKEYLEVQNEGGNNPRVFDNKLRKILNNTISVYENEAQVYGKGIADEMKDDLEKKILKDSEQAFKIVMDNFSTALGKKITDEILNRCKNEMFTAKHHAQEVVIQYAKEFEDSTTGLLHSYLIDQAKFQSTIQSLSNDMAKVENRRDVNNVLFVLGSWATSALIGFATGGAAAVVGMGPLLATMIAGTLGVGAGGATVAGAEAVNKHNDDAVTQASKKLVQDKMKAENIYQPQ